jgi:hypothetical protein
MCNTSLTAPLTGLLPLHTVFTRQRERISSDEEERRRAGFRVVTSYRFQDHGDRPGQLDAIIRDAADEVVARLSYGDSATVRRTNLGPTRNPLMRRTGSCWTRSPASGRRKITRRESQGARMMTLSRPIAASASSRSYKTAATSWSSGLLIPWMSEWQPR